MKVRIIELEGTPEELAASPYLRSLAGSSVVQPDAGASTSPLRASPISHLVGVPEGLDARGVSGRVREMVEAFLLEVTSWDDVDPPEWGKPGSDSKADYLRLKRATVSKQGRGRPPGAFVYLFPARAAVRLRLRVEDVESAEYAKPRGVKKDVAYQAQIPLHHEGMLKEAVSLARKAYEKAGGNATEGAVASGERQPAKKGER